MYCNVNYLLSPNDHYILLNGPCCCCCVLWARATNAAAWLRHRTDLMCLSHRKNVNHMAYQAHMATVLCRVLLFV